MDWYITEGTVCKTLHPENGEQKNKERKVPPVLRSARSILKVKLPTVDQWKVSVNMNVSPYLQPNYWKHYNLSIKELKSILSKLDAVHIWQTLFYFFPEACLSATNTKTFTTYIQSVYRFKFQQKSEAIKVFIRCISQSPAYYNLLRPSEEQTRKVLETSIQDHVPYLPIIYLHINDFKQLVSMIHSSSLMTGDFFEQKTSLFHELKYNSAYTYKDRMYVPIAYHARRQCVELVRIINVHQINPLLNCLPDHNLATMLTHCTVQGVRHVLMYEEMCFAQINK